MDKLPEEIILQIFSFLPLPFISKSVSLVSKQFHHLAYDHNLIELATDMTQEVDVGKEAVMEVIEHDKHGFF